jgi:hypothetical protein
MLSDRMVELPITLPMDHTLINVLRQDVLQGCLAKLDWVREQNGLALALFHPDYNTTAARRDRYGALLDRLAADATGGTRCHGRSPIGGNGAGARASFWKSPGRASRARRRSTVMCGTRIETAPTCGSKFPPACGPGFWTRADRGSARSTLSAARHLLHILPTVGATTLRTLLA